MTISQKQLAANRRNALKGGVRTAKGKAISRMNALKHGLLSKEVLLKGESGKTLEELGKRLRAELRPEGELESFLVDRIVSSTWRLRRAIRIEREMLEHHMRSENFIGEVVRKTLGEAFCDDDGNTQNRFIRYESAVERQIYRALHELIRLQMARKGEKPPAPLAVDVDVSGDSNDGFVS